MNFVPVIFDLETGEAHPLAGPFHELPLFGRNYVRAVLHGPFARVVNTGSLPERPRRARHGRRRRSPAPPTASCCATPARRGRSTARPGARVVTPAGVEGWASSQFLER